MVQEVVRQVGRRIVGQDYMVERLLISLLTRGDDQHLVQPHSVHA